MVTAHRICHTKGVSFVFKATPSGFDLGLLCLLVHDHYDAIVSNSDVMAYFKVKIAICRMGCYHHYYYCYCHD